MSKIKVDAEVRCIPASEFEDNPNGRSLLILRLDIFNQGKSLLGPLSNFVEIQAVYPQFERVEYVSIKRWPETGMSKLEAIEPDSWTAINDAMSIPPTLRAIRIFVALESIEGIIWTWHKTFDISSL
jgi:hypothetical protein